MLESIPLVTSDPELSDFPAIRTVW